MMDPWKAPDSDSIPADFLRSCKSCLLPHLYDILVKCWREGMVPQDMRNAKIITLVSGLKPKWGKARLRSCSNSV